MPKYQRGRILAHRTRIALAIAVGGWLFAAGPARAQLLNQLENTLGTPAACPR